MRRPTTLFFLSLFSGLLIHVAHGSLDPLRPARTPRPPAIDGVLDDGIWNACPSVSNFKTFAPDFGKDASEKTIGYMAYDSENIYFAFRCFDREPGKIKSVVSSRDNVGSDDWVCINLDSFNDQQALYAFYVNPDGIQMDSRFAAGRAIVETAGL